MRALVEWLLARNKLLPLMARGPKRLAVELTIIADVGHPFPWILVWRVFQDVGHQGSIPQENYFPIFASMKCKL